VGKKEGYGIPFLSENKHFSLLDDGFYHSSYIELAQQDA